MAPDTVSLLSERVAADICMSAMLPYGTKAAHQNSPFKVYGAYVVSRIAAVVKAEHLLVVSSNSNLWEYTHLRQRNISFLSTRQQ